MLRYLFFVVTFNTIGRLPTRFLYWIFPYVGDLCYMLAAGQRHSVWKNLRRIMPPETPERKLRSVARQIFRNVALYYVDLARMPHTDPDDLFINRMDIHGLDEILMPAVREGKGVIMLSAHCGNPEIAGQGLLHVGVNVLALTEPLEPPRLSKLLNNARSSRGLTFVPVSISNVKRVMKTLRSGGVVALMGDRDIEGPKQRLPFFGVAAWMPTGPIEVALRTGATVVPSFSGRRNNYIITADLEEPLELVRTGDFEADVRAGQLEYMQRLERYLRDDPSRWMVLESIWDDEPDAEPREQNALEHEYETSRKS